MAEISKGGPAGTPREEAGRLSVLSWLFIAFFFVVLVVVVVMDWTNIMVVPLALIPPAIIIWIVYISWLRPKLLPLGVYSDDRVLRFAFGGFFPGAVFCLLFEAGFSLFFALVCLSDQLKTIADGVSKGDPHGGGVARQVAANVSKTPGFWIFLILTSYVTAATVEEVMKACVLRLNLCGSCFGPEEEMCVQRRIRILPAKRSKTVASLMNAATGKTAEGGKGGEEAPNYLYGDDDGENEKERGRGGGRGGRESYYEQYPLGPDAGILAASRGKTPRIMAYSTLALLIAIGLGFSTAENLLYIFAESFATPLKPHLSSVASKAMLAAVRGIISMPVHCICVGFTALRLTLRDMQLYKREILERIADEGGEWVEVTSSSSSSSSSADSSSTTATTLAPADPFAATPKAGTASPRQGKHAQQPGKYRLVYSPSEAQRDADAINVWSWPRILWPAIALHGTFDLMALSTAALLTSAFGDGLVTSMTLLLGLGMLLLGYWILSEQYEDVFDSLDKDAQANNGDYDDDEDSGADSGAASSGSATSMSVARKLGALPTTITGGTIYRILRSCRRGQCCKGRRCFSWSCACKERKQKEEGGGGSSSPVNGGSGGGDTSIAVRSSPSLKTSPGGAEDKEGLLRGVTGTVGSVTDSKVDKRD